MKHSEPDLRLDPACSVITAFGGGNVTEGIKQVAAITGKHQSRVLRWMYSKVKGGTGGQIPFAHVEGLLAEARRRELPLTLKDVSPHVAAVVNPHTAEAAAE